MDAVNILVEENKSVAPFIHGPIVLGITTSSIQMKILEKPLSDKAKNSGIRYQTILVDKAQDFYDEWFQALLAVLNSQTNSLFFAYDNTQSVYGQPHRRKSGWRWTSLGLNIPGGRSQIFDLNYRNSPEILELAWKFIQPAIIKTDIDRKSNSPRINKIIEPRKKLSRSSGVLSLLVSVRLEDMPGQIARQVKRALERTSLVYRCSDSFKEAGIRSKGRH